LIPQYDKSLNQGKGDRSDPKYFKKVQGPIDLVIVEGWMLGFKPSTLHSDEEVNIVDQNPGMEQVN
jgi:D-glycerate 3-kinase